MFNHYVIHISEEKEICTFHSRQFGLDRRVRHIRRWRHRRNQYTLVMLNSWDW